MTRPELAEAKEPMVEGDYCRYAGDGVVKCSAVEATHVVLAKTAWPPRGVVVIPKEVCE